MTDVFAAGAIVQGMFFPELHQDYHIRFGLVLGWYCPDHPNTLFPGPACPLCDQEGKRTVFEEAHHESHAKKRLLDERLYQEADYWKCQHCKNENYYPAKEQVCPLCGKGRTKGAARTRVWVRSAPAGEVEQGQDRGIKDQIIMYDALNHALQNVDPTAREAFLRVEYGGKSEEEVAQELSISPEEVRSAIGKAKRQLRKDPDLQDLNESIF